MSTSTIFGLILALVTAAAFNWSWVRAAHDHLAAPAADDPPPVALAPAPLRQPPLAASRSWSGSAGWALYIVALRLAPLSLVQAVSAGGLGAARRPRAARGGECRSRAASGSASASRSSGSSSSRSRSPAARATSTTGSWDAVAAWFVVSFAVAGIAIGPAASRLAPGAGFGHRRRASSYAAADVGTKEAVHGGTLILFGAPVWALPPPRVQPDPALVPARAGARHRGPLVVLHERAPDRRGPPIYHETTPPGMLGALRFVAFGCVVSAPPFVARREGRPPRSRAEHARAEIRSSGSGTCDRIADRRISQIRRRRADRIPRS